MIRGTKIKNSEGSPYPASEDIYQTVFEEAADGIFLADGQGSYIDVNRRGCEMLGYAREELLSLSIKDLVPPEDLVRDPPQLDELRAGKTLLRERRLRRGDDSLLSVEISTRMLADGRFLSIVRDISERKQAEELLRQQEHEFRTLMEHSPDIIARFDREGRYLYVNSTMEKVTGIPVEEFLGRRIGERLSALMKQVVPEEVLDLRQVIDRVFTSGCGFETEIHLIFPSGEHVFNVRLIPEADKAGEVVSVLLFARDVTEQKQAEKALRTSEERLQLALNAAQMGQWDWNMVTGEVVWSPKCLAIYGLSPNAPMSYERFLQAVHPEDRERIDAALKRAVEECSCYDEMKRIIWPDGSLHWTASRGQAYCEAAGQPVRMIGVTIDITEWKEAE
jgi:PAS domain S-box-containing protein